MTKLHLLMKDYVKVSEIIWTVRSNEITYKCILFIYCSKMFIQECADSTD